MNVSDIGPCAPVHQQDVSSLCAGVPTAWPDNWRSTGYAFSLRRVDERDRMHSDGLFGADGIKPLGGFRFHVHLMIL